MAESQIDGPSFLRQHRFIAAAHTQPRRGVHARFGMQPEALIKLVPDGESGRPMLHRQVIGHRVTGLAPNPLCAQDVPPAGPGVEADRRRVQPQKAAPGPDVVLQRPLLLRADLERKGVAQRRIFFGLGHRERQSVDRDQIEWFLGQPGQPLGHADDFRADALCLQAGRNRRRCLGEGVVDPTGEQQVQHYDLTVLGSWVSRLTDTPPSTTRWWPLM